MLKKLKHGFTLVELVIVIAVIAVLAAVLIPTFISVIDNANNSADLQLTRNMNTVLSTEVYADQTATAENLRKLLKDNGLNNLTTKKKDNIIAYHQSANKFELINLSKANITTEELSTGTAATVEADVSTDGALVIDPNPFSFAEIFKDYTIVSTGGNDLAEAIYGFYNTRIHTNKDAAHSEMVNNFKALWKKICDIKIDKKDAVIEGFKKLINESVFLDCFDTWPGIRGACRDMAFIKIGNNNEDVKVIGVDKENNSSPTIDGSEVSPTSSQWKEISTYDRTITTSEEYYKKLKVSPSRVFIPEATTKLDLYMFKIFLENAVVVIPDTIESVVNNGSINDSDLSNIVLLGNIEVLTESMGGNLYGAQVSSQHIQEVKESVKTFGANLAAVPYVSSNKDDENKPGYYTDLKEALAAAEESVKAFGLPREVILASNYTIQGNESINIPQNVTLHVPYAIEGGIKTGQGTGEKTTLVDDELKENNATGYTYQNYKRCTLTIAAGANLTVEGTLEIGAECCPQLLTFQSASYSGCVGGNYGQIDNSGTITVKNGGKLNAYGYIKCKDSGIVTAESGATVFEPIVVTDTIDASSVISSLTSHKNFPYMRYALPNITNLEIKYGGMLNITNINMDGSGLSIAGNIEGYFVGSDETPEKGGLLTLESGGSVVIKYDYKNAVKDDKEGNLAGDIGINTVTLSGKVQTGIILNLFPDVQKQVLCYISYNFEFEITSGCTFTVTNRYAALPGAKITVKDGGTLSVANGGEFYVVDDYNSDGEKVLGGKSYPTPELLGDLYKNGGFFVEAGGTFKVESGAKVGGIVQVVKDAKIEIVQGANLEGKFSVGANIGEGNNNLQEYTLPLKYKNGESETAVSGAGTITVA